MLDGTLLLCVLFHEDVGLRFELFVDGHEFSALSQLLILLILSEEIVLNLDESLIADLLDLTLKVVVLLFKLLDVLVFDLKGALDSVKLFLFLSNLLFVLLILRLHLSLLLRKVKLGIFDLLDQVFVVELLLELVLRGLQLVLQLNLFHL